MHFLEDGYSEIHALFTTPHLTLVGDALVNGHRPALSVFADDFYHPRAALVWDIEHNLYLVGEPRDSFVSELCTYVKRHLIPIGRKRQLGIYKIASVNGVWDEAISRIFADVPITTRMRVLLRLEAGSPLSVGHVPDGIVIRRIDEALIGDKTLRNVESVIAEIEWGWRLLNWFFEDGFGFCAVVDDEIISWCTAEYMSEGKCGIGIETVEAHQNRGIATSLAHAFVAHCAEKGITAYWDAWASNLPSIAVAEKVGFREWERYSIHVAMLA